MNSILLLIIICCIYYLLKKYFEDSIETKYHYYFGGFVIIYIIILYLFNFEYEFIYKILKNIYDTKNQPLYSFDSKNSNAQLFESEYPNFNFLSKAKYMEQISNFKKTGIAESEHDLYNFNNSSMK